MFLGASYFRGLGQGPALRTARRAGSRSTPPRAAGEEFPRFVEFWIERPGAPAQGARRLRAARLAARDGRVPLRRSGRASTTALDVDAQLFLRKNVAKLGLAPLTSMFFFGEQPARAGARRLPAARSTTPTACRSGRRAGEWIWRPLVNPKRLLVTSFALTRPARLRPDAARPRVRRLPGPRGALRPAALGVDRAEGAVGPGRVELVQIPVPDETNDNIVAYWVPDGQPKPGGALRLRLSRAVAEGSGGAAADAAGCADAPRPRLHEGRRRQHRAARRLRGPGASTGCRRTPWWTPRRGPTATARCWSDTRSATGSTGGWRFVVRFRRSTRRSPWSCGRILHRGSEVLIGNVELHPPPGLAPEPGDHAPRDGARHEPDAHGVRRDGTRAISQPRPSERPAERLADFAPRRATRRLLLTVAGAGARPACSPTSWRTDVLPYHGQQPLELAILSLFAILFAWVSLGFWTALTRLRAAVLRA